MPNGFIYTRVTIERWEKGFVEGIVLCCVRLPDSDVSDYCWHWEKQGTGEDFVCDKTLKHSNLKVDQCKAMERLGSWFYASAFLLFFAIHRVSLCEEVQPMISLSRWRHVFLYDKIFWKGISQSLISLNSLPVTSLQNIEVNRHGSFFTSSPGPGPWTRTGTGKKKYRCYVHMCLYIHRLQVLVWNWFALIRRQFLKSWYKEEGQ